MNVHFDQNFLSLCIDLISSSWSTEDSHSSHWKSGEFRAIDYVIIHAQNYCDLTPVITSVVNWLSQGNEITERQRYFLTKLSERNATDFINAMNDISAANLHRSSLLSFRKTHNKLKFQPFIHVPLDILAEWAKTRTLTQLEVALYVTGATIADQRKKNIWNPLVYASLKTHRETVGLMRMLLKIMTPTVYTGGLKNRDRSALKSLYKLLYYPSALSIDIIWNFVLEEQAAINSQPDWDPFVDHFDPQQFDW